MGRAPCCEKVGLKKGRWTAEEDEILMKYIQHNGEGSWRSLPKNAGLLRCGKSCRLRWLNYLRTDLKRGNITAEEENLIIKLHSSLGNRWSLIAGHLPGRTDNEIKNYWNSHLSRRIDSFRRPSSEATLPILMNLAKMSGGCKRKGGRTSRAAMKKNNNNNNQSNVKLMSNNNREAPPPERSADASSSMTIHQEKSTTTLMNSIITVQNEERQSMTASVGGDPCLDQRESVVFCSSSSSSSTSSSCSDQEMMRDLHDHHQGRPASSLGPIDDEGGGGVLLETAAAGIMCPAAYNEMMIMGDGMMVVDSNEILTFTDQDTENGPGFMSFNEERESGVIMDYSNIKTIITPPTSGEEGGGDQMTSTTTGGLSSTTCNEGGGGGGGDQTTTGEWYSCNSSNYNNITPSCFEDDQWVAGADDNWDWVVGVVEGHNLNLNLNLWEDGEEMLSWLEQ